MAVGIALADGRIESLDEPVARYLPEWDDEARGRITLRQLLEETSGLETGGDVPRPAVSLAVARTWRRCRTSRPRAACACC